MSAWDFRVSGYRRGELLVETRHRGLASMEMEVLVWKERMDRGECDRIIVVDLRPARVRQLEPRPWASDLTAEYRRPGGPGARKLASAQPP